MLHIYHGDGKGKTTAAMGAALRALGHGWPVAVAQFLKDGDSGEVRVLAGLPGATVLAAGTGGKFTFQMTEAELAGVRERQEGLLDTVGSLVRAGEARLVVLDEVLDALATGTLAEGRLTAFLDACRPDTEVIITGRGPSEELLARAAYVTEMRAEKHPYEHGVAARPGVEW